MGACCEHISLAVSGGVHAVQSEWPVYHGGPGVQFSLHAGGTWLCHPGSNQQSRHAQAEPYPAALCRLHLHPRLILCLPCLHENEVTVSIVYTILRFLKCTDKVFSSFMSVNLSFYSKFIIIVG